MVRALFLDDTFRYTRAALVEDGTLREIHTEKEASDAQEENLYVGRIQSIRPAIHAAFVDIGTERNAFLPLDDDVKIRCGDMLIVQGAARQAVDTKGLRITTRVNLAGKWLVLIPGESGVHVSKKIKGEALRNALMELGSRICPGDCAMIIRTASGETSASLLEEEAAELHARWQAIQSKAQGMARPGLLYQRESLAMRLIRDIGNLDRIVTNRSGCFSALIAAQEMQKIPQQTHIELYEEKDCLLFDAFGIEPQIDKALRRRVWLPCGGYLIIDLCEAMTVIDVNSGKMILGRDPEDTALKVNLEAADEIARQLRLRDLGGIIVADFIDMQNPSSRQLLLDRMKSAAAQDRAPVSIEGMTRLGLMEITRKRVHASLHKRMQVSCSYCSGGGAVLSCGEVAMRALRQTRRMALSGQRGPFVIRCAPAAAQELTMMRSPLRGTQIYALSIPGKHAEKFDIEQIGAGTSLPAGAVLLQDADIARNEQ